MVDLASLERKCTCKGTEGSNPSLSSTFLFLSLRLKIILFVFFFISHSNLSAQTTNDQWIFVCAADANKQFIDSASLTKTNGDIFVWIKEEFSKPLQLEGIPNDIFISKTFYLFNSMKNKYSIIQVIYYDENENVLKSYSYERSEEIPDIKYSSPIIKNSSEEEILKTCLELLNK